MGYVIKTFRVIDEKNFKTSNNIVDLRKKYFKEKEK